jgi:hypothetical protein
MNQLHPRQDGSARARSVITRRDLMRKARSRASGNRPKAGAVLTAAAARLYRRKLGKAVCWTGRERLRSVCRRLRVTVRETHTTGRTVQLCPDSRAISAMAQEEEGQMTAVSAGLATRRYQELPFAPRRDVITPGDPGYDQPPGSLSRPC